MLIGRSFMPDLLASGNQTWSHYLGAPPTCSAVASPPTTQRTSLPTNWHTKHSLSRRVRHFGRANVSLTAANITPPKTWQSWADLITAFLKHLVRLLAQNVA